MRRESSVVELRSGKKRGREAPPPSSKAKKQQKVQASGEQARRFEAWAHGDIASPDPPCDEKPHSPGSARPPTPCSQREAVSPTAASPGSRTNNPDSKSSAAKGTARGRRGAMLVTAAGGAAPPPPSPQRKQRCQSPAGLSPGRAVRSPSSTGRGTQSPGSARQPSVEPYASNAHPDTAAVQAKLPAELAVLLRMFGEHDASDGMHVLYQASSTMRTTMPLDRSPVRRG